MKGMGRKALSRPIQSGNDEMLGFRSWDQAIGADIEVDREKLFVADQISDGRSFCSAANHLAEGSPFGLVRFFGKARIELNSRAATSM